jgi:hypothetical protein
MDSRHGLCLGLLIAALAVPSAAQAAAVRCVPVSGPGCTSSYATIGAAVSAASTDDTIRIAAGTYSESISTTTRLNFVGAGSGATTISPASGSALSLSRGGSVRSLRVIGATGFFGSTALLLQPDVDGTFAYTVADVVGTGGNGTDPFFGIGGAGLYASSSSAARIVNLSLSGGAFRAGVSTSVFQGTGLALNGRALTATVANTSAVGPASPGGDGFAASGGSTVDVTGLSAQGHNAAQLGDSTVTLRRSVLDGVAAGVCVYDVLAATPTTVNLVDDLVTATPTSTVNAAALTATTAVGGSAVAVNVRGSTIVARGVDPQYAVVARPGVGAPTATIDLRNTIAQLEGGAESDEADVAADRGAVTASHSDLAKTLQLNGGTVTGLTGTILLALPLFSAGAFTLQESSPLVDRGDPAVVTAGERDLAGRPRAVDYDGDGVAQPDIGAYELPAPPTVEPPPPPPNPRPSLGTVSMTNKVFAPEEAHAKVAVAADRARARDRVRARERDRARARVKRGTIFRYLLSEPATVTIAIERRARGRRARARARGVARCAKPTRRNVKGKPCIRWLRAGTLKSVERAGSQRTPFSGRLKGRALKPGRYRARVVAKDGGGSRSRESRVAFKIVRAR